MKYIIIFLLLALFLSALPLWHEAIQNITLHLPGGLRFALLFLLDPTEYGWKWVIPLVIALVLLVFQYYKHKVRS